MATADGSLSVKNYITPIRFPFLYKEGFGFLTPFIEYKRVGWEFIEKRVAPVWDLIIDSPLHKTL